MYERNAIVIDRYFASIFGYDKKNNLKNNHNNYYELVKGLEEYQKASENENNIMNEFENTANRIRETQKQQEVYNKRSIKFIETTKSLFESLDEEPEVLRKKFEKLAEEINKNNQEIKLNSEKFVEEIAEFNEKSEVRSICGRERRTVEDQYQKILKLTIENFNNISRDKLKEAKSFVKSQNKNDAKNEIKEKIMQNGAKEKVPFDENVILTAIDTSTYISEKRAEILLSLFDKTNKLLEEIKNDTVKIEKHKKIATDSKSKLEFLNAISDYIVLFLDNERMNTMGGETEHQRIMNDACSNLRSDLIEIQNMYSLLIKEITGKSSRKAFKELYNIQYMIELKEEEKEFERSISKLNMIGAIVYPDYWRVEGMQKIYDTFKHIITETYGKDLSEFEPMDITFEVNEKELENDEEKIKEDITNENNQSLQVSQNNANEDNNDGNEDNNEERNKESIEIQDPKEEDFFWDEDDEDDELIFSTQESKKNTDEENSNNQNVENINMQEMQFVENRKLETEEDIDKEIDEILGFFDNEDNEDNDDNDENVVITGEDEEKIENSDIDEDKIFDDDDREIEQELEEVQQKKEKKERKKRGLFSRRGK